ncbi:hypothetical protein [Serpentinicella alkaliphila]|uniref:Uncharacterized protein n=1 Tax=Serpentinicella alkaliphila TaxID=1734049 RepID=A0A4R2T6T2_9FIRM|nr:hypothetical protein [Serpentinicella alkaliphila]TCP97186.1 hypothetical protein EDD79_104714 [Serpentinicella alkaliphila]
MSTVELQAPTSKSKRKWWVVDVHIGNTVICNKEVPGYGDEHIRFGFPNSENDVDELVTFLNELKNIDYLNTKDPKVVSLKLNRGKMRIQKW